MLPLQSSYFIYESLDAMLKVANGPCDIPKESRSSQRAPESWDGGLSYDDAVNLVLNGDMDAARKLSPATVSAANTIVATAESVEPYFRDDGGRWVDVARFNAGEPEHFGDMRVEMNPKVSVSVMVNCAVSANVPARKIDLLGVSVGSAILGLQALGHCVTVYACETLDRGRRATISAPINPNGSTLDISRLMSCLRPYFLRRIMFAVNETAFDKGLREHMGVPCGGYGTVGRMTQADAKKISSADVSVIIDAASFVNFPQDAQQRIIDSIKGGN